MPSEPTVSVNTRERLLNWLIALAAAVAAAIGARYGIEVPPPPPIVIPEQPTRPPAPDTPPTEPTPDALAAIVRISSGNVGCSGTVIGPRRPDGRYWVLSAAHCVNGTGQRWTMRFRDGRQTGAVVVNYNRQSDWAWLVTDANNLTLPHALVADSAPPVGTKIWHAGFGVDVPGNREDGEVTGGVDSNGQLRMKLSVSSGDSGGGIVIDQSGRIVSTVCCTSRRGAVADVWGAAPESFRAGQRDTVDLDEWRPIDVPIREVPKEMPPR
jgi:hypothetical protein